MEDGQFPKSDPIGEAQARFDALTNYEMTLRSVSSAGVSVEARYRYLKPGFIRIDFVRPHAGAVLAYDPKAGRTSTAGLWRRRRKGLWNAEIIDDRSRATASVAFAGMLHFKR